METLLPTLHWNAIPIMTEKQVGKLDTDAQLMLQFKAGDLRAFERLFARHMRPIVNFAYKFVRNREIAEELTQEIFIRVHDAAAGYRPEAKFTTWLYKIATNVCLNEIRRPYFRATHYSISVAASSEEEGRPMELEDRRQAGAQQVMEHKAMAAALRTALQTLPQKQRAAFVLNKYQDLSYQEVAEVMQISEKAVKSLIHRAKEALAARLHPVITELL